MVLRKNIFPGRFKGHCHVHLKTTFRFEDSEPYSLTNRRRFLGIIWAPNWLNPLVKGLYLKPIKMDHV